MVNWNNFIQLLTKLKFFTWIGSIMWSIIAFALTFPTLFYCYTELVAFNVSLVFTAVGIATEIESMILVVMIPQAIRSLAEFVEEVVQEWNGKLKGPGKLIFAFAIIPVITITDISNYLIQNGINMSLAVFFEIGANCALNVAMMFFLLMPGILFGSLTKTFSFKCKLVGLNDSVNSYQQATCLLHQYQVLKSGSALVLFIVSSCCTILTTLDTYYFIIFITNGCLKPDIPTAVSMGLRAALYMLCFFYFAMTANSCFKNFEAIALPLR